MTDHASEVQALHILTTWPPEPAFKEFWWSYSALKHGDSLSIASFAELLASRVMEWSGGKSVTITSPPTSHLPSAADHLARCVTAKTAQTGGKATRLVLPAPLRGSGGRNYAELDLESREKAQRDRYREVGRAINPETRRLVVVNDARITGAQERALARAIDAGHKGLRVLWLYIVRLNRESNLPPEVEHAINTEGIRTAADLVRLGAKREIVVTARLVHRVMALDTAAFDALLATWPAPLLDEMRALARADGLYRDGPFARRLAHMSRA